MNLLKKISDLVLGTPLETDVIPYVDLVTGTTKKAYKSDLKGEPGDNGTVDVNSTTTLAPGSPATVVNVGTTLNALLDFGIPAGSVIYSTILIPDNSIGLDGDWAFSTSSTSNVFYKSGGAWALVNSNKGIQGDTGNGIVSIVLTSTVGLVDTYTITYDDATTTTFDVTNGEKGDVGDAGNGIVSITLINTVGKVKTYQILYTDTTTFNYDVTDGADGEGSGDVLGPATNADGYIPQWDGVDSKTLKEGIPTSTFAPALGEDDNYVTDLEKTSIGTIGNKLDKSGGTMTGKIVKAGTTEVGKTYTPATGVQTVALDASVNNMHIVTGHADGTAITFTITGMTESQPIIVSILQGAVVSTITSWFATIRWAGGTVPILTATVGKRDTFGFIRTGTDTYDGFVIGQNI